MSTGDAKTNRPVVLAFLMTTMALGSIEGTIVATAMPSIVSTLGGFELFSWVFSAYLLTQAVFTPISGSLADTLGRKPVLLVSIAVFLVASAACGFADSMPQLIAFRFVQGVGAAGINTMVVTRDGRRIKTTSVNYIGEGYHYVLGVNFDTTAIHAADAILRDLDMADGDFDASPLADKKLSEAFDRCLSVIGKPVAELTKRERMQIVSMLDDGGLFSIQKAVPYVSERFGVSRFTVYNYLNEIRNCQR